MQTLMELINHLEGCGVVVEGKTHIEELMRGDRRAPSQQLVALMVSGRSYGIHFFCSQASFERDELFRRLGEAGLSAGQCRDIIYNLRPEPSPELASMEGRD